MRAWLSYTSRKEKQTEAFVMERLKGQRNNRDGCETYRIFDKDPEVFYRILSFLCSEFGFEQGVMSPREEGHISKSDWFLELNVDVTKGNITLSLTHERISGFFIRSKQPEGNDYVTAVGNLLDEV